MFDALKNQWQLFRRDAPGERFLKRYQRRRQQAGRGAVAIALIVSGVLLILLGLVLMVIPGPGIPVFVVGAALLAGESQPVARAADATELKLRHLAARFRKGQHT